MHGVDYSKESPPKSVYRYSSSSWKFLLITLTTLIFLPLFFLPLFYVVPLYGSSEAREVHIVSELLRLENWSLPTRNGVLPSKPPFFHWVVATLLFNFKYYAHPQLVLGAIRALSFFSILVITFVSCRLVSSILGTISWRGDDKVNSVVTPFTTIVTGILFSSYLFVSLGMDARVDAHFTMWVLTGILCLLSFFRFGDPRYQAPSLALLSFFVAVAFATLTKGPLGIILPLLIGGVFAITVLGFKPTLALLQKGMGSIILGLIVYTVIVVLWYLIAFIQGGDAFIERQVIFENVRRLIGDKHTNAEGPFFYLRSFPITLAPWSIFFIYLFITQLWSRNQGLGYSTRDTHKERVTLAFALSILGLLLLFTVASGKRHSYQLPLIPLLAIYLPLELNRRSPLRFNKVASFFKSNLLRLIILSVCGFTLLLLEGVRFRLFDQALLSALTQYGINGELLATFLGRLEIPVFSIYLSVVTLLVLLPGAMTTLTATRNLAALGTLVAVLFSFGLNIKGEIKNYTAKSDFVAETLTLAQNSNLPKPYIFKSRYDESFDPILAYLHPTNFEVRTAITQVKKGDEFFVSERGVRRLLKQPVINTKAILTISNGWREVKYEQQTLKETLHFYQAATKSKEFRGSIVHVKIMQDHGV
jgi:hypothetical protein